MTVSLKLLDQKIFFETVNIEPAKNDILFHHQDIMETFFTDALSSAYPFDNAQIEGSIVIELADAVVHTQDELALIVPETSVQNVKSKSPISSTGNRRDKNASVDSPTPAQFPLRSWSKGNITGLEGGAVLAQPFQSSISSDGRLEINQSVETNALLPVAKKRKGIGGANLFQTECDASQKTLDSFVYERASEALSKSQKSQSTCITLSGIEEQLKAWVKEIGGEKVVEKTTTFIGIIEAKIAAVVLDDQLFMFDFVR